MMTYLLNKMEQQLLAAIHGSFYMKPSLANVQHFVQRQKNTREAWREVFNHIYDILIEAKDDVERILEVRKAQGSITDVRQVMKSIAGHAFSNLIIHIFLQNKVMGTIRPDIFITNKKSHIKNFAKIATVYVDGETQKPDVDPLLSLPKKTTRKLIKSSFYL